MKTNFQLSRLLYSRLFVAGPVLLVTGFFYFQPLEELQRRILFVVAVAFIFLSVVQWLLLRFSSSRYLVALQFVSDSVLISAVVFATSGHTSPFAFLFALVIVAAGTQGPVLFVLGMTTLIAASYLISVNLYAWYAGVEITTSWTLSVLMQTSAFLLLGGVMAAIVRRHAGLQDERKQAVFKHKQLQELHGQVISAMQEGIVILGPELRIQDANAAARQLIGGGNSLTGRRLSEAMLLPGELKSFFKHPTSDLFYCEWRQPQQTCLLTVLRLSQDDDSTWLMTLVDISDVRSLEQKLAEQNQFAALGRMASMLAHEVRNPMHTIAQAVELLAPQKKDEGIKSIVLEEISRLNRLVSEMLQYSKPMLPKPRETNMVGLIEASLQQVDMHSEHAMAVHCDVKKLYIDPDHFRLVLNNLLYNAIDASPESGSIRVSLNYKKAGGTNECWVLEVSDQGGGIPEEIRAHLFEPFVTSKQGGTGLGLATVRQVCQSNGWEIEVHSDAEGCRFVITGSVNGNS